MLFAITRRLKPWQQIILFVALFYFLFCNLLPALQHSYLPRQRHPLPESLDPRKQTPLYSYPQTLTTNLIVASTLKDDISWTSHLTTHLPNLKIYRYVSDTTATQFHPPVLNKGREALMYFTFLRDFHDLARSTDLDQDGLADVNIFIHAAESPWHADFALLQSMIFTLAHLDLQQVLQNGYVNLRTTWVAPDVHACPAFNTSKTYEESPDGEERFMHEAFEINFPGEPVPEILAGPCCSQFAVSKDAIKGRNSDVYERTVGWLVETNWPDQLVGRVWEHMWPWLFKGVAKDCGNEVWRTLCVRFKVCFEGDAVLRGYDTLWLEKQRLERDVMGFWKEIMRPGRVERARKMVGFIEDKLEVMLTEAVDRGRDGKIREAAGREQGESKHLGQSNQGSSS